MITCRTLGPVELLVDGRPAPADLLWRKNLALLIYLARSPTRTRAREHLIGLFWADRPEPRARQSLREAIRILRRHLGEAAVDAAGDQVRLAPDALTLDADELAAASDCGDWTTAASLVAGEFLEGFTVPDASGFEDWLAAERLALRQQSVDALVRCAERQLHHGDAAGATQGALRALALDALSEAALGVALRALALVGERAAALERFAAFTVRLRETTGAEPSAELKRLAERVQRERAWRLPEYLVSPEVTEPGAESRRAPLIGRGAALQAVLEQWDAVRSRGRFAVAVIAGDPGVGKTRLLEEVLGRARLDGAAVASAAAVPGDQEQPHAGLLALAKGGLLGAPGIAAAPPPALAALGAELPEWRERFAGEARGAAVLPLGRALGHVVEAAAVEQPVVLAVDDAHRLDAPSLDALSALARDLAAHPVLVALTAERHGGVAALDVLWSRIGRDIEGLSVELAPLETAAIRELARWALPAYDAAALDRVARRVQVDSNGLPLLAVELLHAVAGGLDLGTVSGAWPQPSRTLEQTLPGELPGAVVAAIRVGFRRLSEPAQRALAVAAVLDEHVSPQAIGRGTGLTGDPLSRALDELEWQRWLAADARGYRFLARIVKEVIARDMVSPGQRQRILRDTAAPT